MNTKLKKILATTAALAMVSAAALLVPTETRRLPVSVSYRKAALDSSLVAQIHNNSQTLRKVLVEIESPTTGQAVQKVEIIKPREFVEIGWLQGWRFVPGETLRVHQGGFRDCVELIP